ncbi:MAG: hypothetical protein OXI22_10970 [Defluviicoccus sp.]|nr:hypothetical protein [Defluviicoccus sp.]
MTLVLGIRCTDGVIIGSDSAMTFGPNAQLPTIEQKNREKISVVDGRVVVAGTGYIGCSQRFIDRVRGLWQEKQLQSVDPIEMGRRISRAVIDDFISTKVQPGGFGALVAVPRGQSAELIEFALQDLQPEVKTDANWYASMGSGQTVLDPLLGFARAVFWGDQPPNSTDGLFVATLILKLAIQMSPTGVAGPIQMAVLQPARKGQLAARLLTRDEIVEHEASVDSAIDYFRGYKAMMGGGDETAEEAPAAPASP